MDISAFTTVDEDVVVSRFPVDEQMQLVAQTSDGELYVQYQLLGVVEASNDEEIDVEALLRDGVLRVPSPIRDQQRTQSPRPQTFEIAFDGKETQECQNAAPIAPAKTQYAQSIQIVVLEVPALKKRPLQMKCIDDRILFKCGSSAWMIARQIYVNNCDALARTQYFQHLILKAANKELTIQTTPDAVVEFHRHLLLTPLVLDTTKLRQQCAAKVNDVLSLMLAVKKRAGPSTLMYYFLSDAKQCCVLIDDGDASQAMNFLFQQKCVVERDHTVTITL